MKQSQDNLNRGSTAKSKGEEHQVTYLMKSMEALQRDIANKMNIKDILPIIKKSLQPLSQLVEQVKTYTEEATESTKKILINQTEINQELCLLAKLGWWQSFEEKDGFAVWNKEVANLIPENFIFERDSNLVIVVQQGNYLFKVLSPTNDNPERIVVGGHELELVGESLIKVEKNTSIQVPSEGN
jgi:argininosuccinate lyase